MAKACSYRTHRTPLTRSCTRQTFRSSQRQLLWQGSTCQCAFLQGSALRAASRSASNATQAGVLPAGKRQARVQLPSLLVSIATDEAVQPATSELLDSLIDAGVTAVLLRDAESGQNFFEAAARVKDAVRGRVLLLIEDRVDIAAACQADGVVLSSKGVPITVARQILSDAGTLIGALTTDASASTAAAAAGANFVLMASTDPGQPVPSADLKQTSSSQRSGQSVPTFCSLSATPDVSALLKGGAQGFSGTVAEMMAAVEEAAPQPADTPAKAAQTLLTALSRRTFAPLQSRDIGGGPSSAAPGSVSPSSHSGMLSTLLAPSGAADSVLAREKELMQEILDFLNSAVPDMSEIRLLTDAVKGLDDPFLLVVVGEFNSGKSTVVNALLGAKFLEDGVLPTTNEISVLKHSEGTEATEQTEDGLFVRYLPSQLLRRLNIVDTPGTNVIVDRQQRLTEEFVPRSDLVLFILSADRPFTESEVKFLRYIRQWGKKVIFVVNKADLLREESEVKTVCEFVADNARSMLGVDAATVLPVSARLALQAKLESGSGEHGGVLESVDVSERLQPNAMWHDSRFGKLERFMLNFLTGGGDGDKGASSETVRLKLQTPVFVADALMQAAGKQLEVEHDACSKELAAIEAVATQLKRFEETMLSDGAAQRSYIKDLFGKVVQRSEAAVNDLLQLRNAGMLTSYVFGGGPDGEASRTLRSAAASDDLISEIRDRSREHAAWLETNVSKQVSTYNAFAASRSGQTDTDAEASTSEQKIAFGGSKPESLEIAEELDTDAGVSQLEQSVRDVVFETASTTGGAIAFSAVLTAVLPTTLEDLLALALAGALAYISLLSWPLKRSDIKGAVAEQYTAQYERLDKELKSELEQALGKATNAVNGVMKPLRKDSEAALAICEKRQSQLKQLQGELEDLRVATAKL